jgi:ligand-binding sensor domain-containing protein
VVALLLAATSVSALDPNRQITAYMIDFWQEDSGLPQKFVGAIIQSRDGYLWIGTRGGLARFDGVRFTTFDDLHPGQLPQNEVWALAEDRDGAVWVGTFGGGVSRFFQGKFTTYRAAEGLPNEFVRALACAPDGSVWIGTDSGLTRLKDGRFTVYTEKDSLPDDQIRRLHVDPTGTAWIGTRAGLASIGTDGRLIDQTQRYPELKDSIGAITDDGQGGLWLGTGSQGLLRFKDGVMERVTMKNGLDIDTITDVCVDLQGTVWMSTPDQLFRYRNGRAERLVGQVTRLSGNHTLQTSSLYRLQKVFADREGSVWVGTALDGIARIRDAIFSTVQIDSESNRPWRTNAILADSRGAVWIALWGGPVARLEEEHITRFDSTASGHVDTLFEDRNGTVWIEHDDALFRFQNGRFVPLPFPARANITSSLVARDGTVWLGDHTAGLLRLRDGRFTHYGKEEGLPGIATRALAEARNGDVWVGTRDGGLVRLHDGRPVATFSVEQGLPNASVAALYVDAEDTVWVATRTGLARIRDGRVWTFSPAQGLPANHFFQIIEDDLGYLWMTYARGIVRVSRQAMNDVADGRARTADVRTFGTESGMKSTAMVVTNQPSISKAPDGRLWFATAVGATTVNPAAILVNRVPPPVHVESIRVDRVSSIPAEGQAFPPGNGEVEISYVGLSFVAPERVRFKYQLEGFDSGWIEADSRRVAYYTNLPPGSYRFRVQACNNDGVWNETGDALRFRLLPHWYQRRSVHAAAALLVIALAAATYRWRLHEHKRRAVQLAAKVDEAVAQIKTLRGLLPICASCKKIRDDGGYWNQMETYFSDHSDVDFSHSVCPECMEKLYPEYAAHQKAST